MNLKAFAAEVRRRWRTFIVVAAIPLIIGVTWLLATSPEYVSTARLMVSISGSTTAAAYQNDEVVNSRVNSYIPLLTSDVVAQRVVDTLKLPTTAAALASSVSATRVPPNTSIIDLAVTAESPTQARAVADAYAEEFISYVTALETPTGQDGQKIHVTAVDSASQPRSNNIERIILAFLAAALGILLGAVAVWVRALADPIVRTAERADAASGVPVLAAVTAEADSAAEMASYHHLHIALPGAATPSGYVLAIVSVSHDVDGCTLKVAMNLARAVQSSGGRCAVVDAGRTPTAVHSDGSADADRVDEPRPERDTDEWPEVALWSDDPEQLTALRDDHDLVLAAAPPTVPEALALSRRTDGVLLILDPQMTRRDQLRQVAEAFDASGAHVIGLVLIRGGGAVPHITDRADSESRPSDVRVEGEPQSIESLQ